MPSSTKTDKKEPGAFKQWLLEGYLPRKNKGEDHAHHHTHPWYKVMCLTGVDYFSTLGYQPGIAFLAAGALSPIATLILILLTLFGALPIYSKVAAASPNGEGSISMLEGLLTRWESKVLVLVLLGFAATDFIITITLSAADATAHIIENPFTQQYQFLHHEVWITLFLVGSLGAVFLKGFKEAVGIAVFLVVIYLSLNAVVIGVGLYELTTHASLIPEWRTRLFTAHSNPAGMIGAAILVFPKLALGLSGFETGVAVMPLVKGDATDTHTHPLGRIRNTRKLLRVAAIIMSVFLMASSFVTAILIPPEAFAKGGEANGRALSFLAHEYLGDYFGTVYDVSTIFILWFAGASAMAGLLNIVPRYLPRYGMAPEWAKATRPLVLVFTGIAFAVTIIFKANVDAQGGAYATGVLVLMTSAAIAVTMAAWKSSNMKYVFAAITVVFAYTTITNIVERTDGVKIASFFIGAIILTSLISRAMRSTELRIEHVELDNKAKEFIKELTKGNEIRIIPNRRDRGNEREYLFKEKEVREDNHIPAEDAIVFFEVRPTDASEFTGELKVRGVSLGPYKILRTKSPAVPNAIAAFLLEIRKTTGKIPHAYFGWSEGNPIQYVFRYIFLGEGDTAPVTREVLRLAEPDPDKRPSIHIGG
jgi:hypothetical protein